MNNKLLLYSPVADQDFIWLASYMDGTYLSEYNFDSKLRNNYDTINKSHLIRFGLIGQGMDLYFEIYGGEYKIAGRLIELSYFDRRSNKEYKLTGYGLLPYNHIHQYKNAESSFNSGNNSGYGNGTITQYNFGYTKNLTVNGVNFTLKTTCCIPYGKNFYLNIELTADQDFEHGMILIRKNGTQLFELDAPLEKNIACAGQWTIT